jgi:glycerol uptake facilitator-like aquaporin
MPLAISLIIASFISAFFLANFSQSTKQYWVATIDLQSGHQISTGDLWKSMLLEAIGSFILVFMYLCSTEEKTKFTKDSVL